MTAIISASHSPTSSPYQNPSPSNSQSPSNLNPPALPPLNTSNPNKRSISQRPQSYAQTRMSSFSANSRHSDSRSRPVSFALPTFHSSLSYTLVRDFAYPVAHPWHYGPPPEVSEAPSGNSTPASERQRRLSDPANATWEGANSQWSAGSWRSDEFFSSQQLPRMAFGDGPPYSEDEDLQSPVVVSSRHKKHKSTFAAPETRSGDPRDRGQEHELEGEDDDRLSLTQGGRRNRFNGTNGDQTQGYYNGEEHENIHDAAEGLVTYPPDQATHSLLAPDSYVSPGQRDSHFATTLPNRSYIQGDLSEDSDDERSGELGMSRDSRYSRDYQFTIASPDEEMHGKAVALFDFTRENENELPLTEGQVIWVSYRHGQGWLVAEDPKTGDAGLVPEEYVRLLRDIEGGLSYLSGDQEESALASPVTEAAETAATPTPAEQGHTPQNNIASNGEKRPPIVSIFSTSSKDLKPYPHHLLDDQARGSPPQVVHYGSQSNTPTLTSPARASAMHVLHGFDSTNDIEEQSEEEEPSEADTEESR